MLAFDTKEQDTDDRHKQTGKEGKGSFLKDTFRRLSINRFKAVNSRRSECQQVGRMTLNINNSRPRPCVAGLQATCLRRVCFKLDDLVELRTYVQVETEKELADPSGKTHTVADMTKVNPYADSTPLDRADLYTQCCKIYRTEPLDQILRQLRGKGQHNVAQLDLRELLLKDVFIGKANATALGDVLALPITGRSLTKLHLENCALSDNTLRIILSCISSSSKIEDLIVRHNPQVTRDGIKTLICFIHMVYLSLYVPFAQASSQVVYALS